MNAAVGGMSSTAAVAHMQWTASTFFSMTTILPEPGCRPALPPEQLFPSQSARMYPPSSFAPGTGSQSAPSKPLFAEEKVCSELHGPLTTVMSVLPSPPVGSFSSVLRGQADEGRAQRTDKGEA